MLQSLRSRNSFLQNVAFMSMSSLWNMGIQIIFFPILARIYDPEAYGTFSVINSAVMITGTVLTLGYTRAIVLAKEENMLQALLRLCLRSLVWTSVVLFLITVAFGDLFLELMNATYAGYWVYSIPVLAILLALDQIGVQWSIREKLFKKVSLVEIPLALGSKLFNVGYGKFISAQADGLILTSAIMYGGRFLLFVTGLIDNGWKRMTHAISQESLQAAKEKFANYPRYILTSGLLNTASSYVPVLLLPAMTGNTSYAGFFTYALIVLDLPVRLLSSGIASVFLQRSTELWPDQPEALQERTLKLYYRLLLIAAGVVVVIGGAGEEIYAIVFSEQWAEAGAAASFLVLSYFFRYAGMPLSSLFLTTAKERELFIFQALLFLSRLLGIAIPAYLGWAFLDIIFFYSVLTAAVTFIFGLWPLKLTGLSLWKPAFITLALFIASCALAFGIQFILSP